MSKTVDVFYRLSVTDRASAGFRKVADGSREARKEVEKLEGAAEDAGDAIEDAFDGDAVDGLNDELDKARRKTRQLGDEAKESGRGFDGMAKSAKRMVRAIAAAEVTKFFVKQGKAAVNAAAQIESYQATLETMLGSTQAARDRMEEYKDIAKITPFGLEDVVEGGNQLQAIGRYSRQNLEMLGDLAAATNKPMEQVMNAYAKLATGQKGEAARMFQDLLITRDDWVAATGKGVSKSGELLASTEEMLSSLPKIIAKKGYGGMMAKQAEKANGMFSNLGDSVFSLRAALGERMMPTVKSVTGVLTGMVNTMEKAVRVPLEQKIAQEKTELNLLVGALEDVWEKEDQKARLLDEISSKYPEFLKGLDLEKVGLQGVKDKLVEVNAEYDKKMRKAALARRLEVLDEEAGEEMDDILKYEISIGAREQAEEARAKIRSMLPSGYSLGANDRIYHHLQGVGSEEVSQSWVDAQGNGALAAAMSELETASANMAYGNLGRDKKKLAEAEKKYYEYKARKAAIEALYGEGGAGNGGQNGGQNAGGQNGGQNDGGNDPNGDTPGGEVVAGTTYGGGSGGSGSGGGSGKTVTTNIGTLVGKIEIHTTTLQESEAEVKRLVTQALLEAVPSDL